MVTSAATAGFSFQKLVDDPISAGQLPCESCAIVRGSSITGGSTALGMLGVTAVHSYHFLPEVQGSVLVKHAASTIAKSLYGTILIALSFLVGFAVTQKKHREVYVNEK